MGMAMLNVWRVVMGVFQNIMDMNMRMRSPGTFNNMFMQVVSIMMYMSVVVNNILMNVHMIVFFHQKNVCP